MERWVKDGEATLLIVGGLLGQVQDRKLHALRNDGPAKMGDPWSYQQARNVGDACRWHIVLRYIIYIYSGFVVCSHQLPKGK